MKPTTVIQSEKKIRAGQSFGHAPPYKKAMKVMTAASVLKAQLEDVCSMFGVTFPQFSVLAELAISDGSFVSQIHDRLPSQSPDTVRLIKRLESKGMLTRQRMADDERHVCVTLTENGRSIHNEALPMLIERLNTLGY